MKENSFYQIALFLFSVIKNDVLSNTRGLNTERTSI